MRIAFHAMGSSAWLAGKVYLGSLLAALGYFPSIQTYLLVPRSAEDWFQELSTLTETLPYEYQRPRRLTREWAKSKLLLIRGATHEQLAIQDILAARGIECIFSGKPLTVDAARLLWLPDFQHLHFPGNFTPQELAGRNHEFRLLAHYAHRVVLLSEAVKKDFSTFAPEYAHKAVVVSPVSYIPSELYLDDPAAVAARYNLPDKFVLVPNSFWKHKNHGVIIQALNVLRKQGLVVNVVCTGSPVDYRFPDYFAQLWTMVSRWNLYNQFFYLGIIPHDHVLSLIRRSVFVLSSSQFEGWGIGVDEARSVGKYVLLSNIPPHREQAPPFGTYFDPDNTEDLAEKIATLWSQLEPGPHLELEAAARQELPQRMKTFANRFLTAAREAIDLL